LESNPSLVVSEPPTVDSASLGMIVGGIGKQRYEQDTHSPVGKYRARRNPKHEIRNSKQARRFKIPNSKQIRTQRQRFGHSSFGFRICFGFRASDFESLFATVPRTDS
jgi:hypothetical protein